MHLVKLNTCLCKLHFSWSNIEFCLRRQQTLNGFACWLTFAVEEYSTVLWCDMQWCLIVFHIFEIISRGPSLQFRMTSIIRTAKMVIQAAGTELTGLIYDNALRCCNTLQLTQASIHFSWSKFQALSLSSYAIQSYSFFGKRNGQKRKPILIIIIIIVTDNGGSKQVSLEKTQESCTEYCILLQQTLMYSFCCLSHWPFALKQKNKFYRLL